MASEFFEQGDIEKSELHIKPMDMMDRDKKDQLPSMQVGFIDSICMPVYQVCCAVWGSSHPIWPHFLYLFDLWPSLILNTYSVPEREIAFLGQTQNFLLERVSMHSNAGISLNSWQFIVSLTVSTT